jgi:hypothetical protein
MCPDNDVPDAQAARHKVAPNLLVELDERRQWRNTKTDSFTFKLSFASNPQVLLLHSYHGICINSLIRATQWLWIQYYSIGGYYSITTSILPR